jgi:hypothetical protein
MMTEIRRWQPASMTQQDDITLIVVDVAQSRWSSPVADVETIGHEAHVSA